MIALQLHCHDEHSFEAWFKNEQACEAQAKIGLIECPYCGSTNISKTTDKRAEEQAPPVEQEDIHARAHEVAQQILEAVGKLRDYAEDNFEPTKAVSTKSEETQPVENATENDELALDEDLTDVEGQPSGSFGSDRSD